MQNIRSNKNNQKLRKWKPAVSINMYSNENYNYLINPSIWYIYYPEIIMYHHHHILLSNLKIGVPTLVCDIDKKKTDWSIEIIDQSWRKNEQRSGNSVDCRCQSENKCRQDTRDVRYTPGYAYLGHRSEVDRNFGTY